MKYLFVAVVILVIFLISNRSGYFFISKEAAYKDCMARTKLNYITKKGADHIAAQCKAFVLDKIMVK